MLRIIKIGMDVHSKTYTLCALEPKIGEEDRHDKASELNTYTYEIDSFSRASRVFWTA